MTSALQTTQAPMPAAVMYDRLQAVKATLAPDLNNAELQLFAMVAERSGLDPFAKQLYAVKRKGRVTFQTGIDGYRSIAARTGEYEGQDEPAFGDVCTCKEQPAGHPISATVRVYRTGMPRGLAATSFWHEYKPAGGESGRGDEMWRRMPRVMLAKVAEALALRKAFPWVLTDVYTREEMDQADSPARPAPTTPAPTARDRIATQRAKVEKPQVAAVTSTSDGRPVDRETSEITEGEYREELAVPAVGEDLFATEQPAQASDLRESLIARALASDSTPSTLQQKQALNEILKPLGALPVRAVLQAIWDIDVQGVTAAIANAIIEEAEADPQGAVGFRLKWAVFANELRTADPEEAS